MAKAKPNEAQKPESPAQKLVKKPAEQTFGMPAEVKEWIEQADSRIKYLTNENKRLKDEVAKLKSYKIWAEQKILGRSEE
jgi:cell division protein FtsB